MKICVTLIVGLLALSGCATSLSNGDQATTATSTGLNIASAAQIGVGGGSAMGGGLVSGKIGAGLSESEKRSALAAEYKALEYTPSGQPVTWKSEQSNRYGEVVAAQPYRVGSQDCRQYSHTVFSGGAKATARGTACRNADGSWTPLA